MLLVEHPTSDAKAGTTGWQEPTLPRAFRVAAYHDGRLPVLAEFRSTAEWKALGRTASAANRGIPLVPTQSIGGLTPKTESSEVSCGRTSGGGWAVLGSNRLVREAPIVPGFRGACGP
ncbi:Hypothetical protein CINCED_3A015972 [Cinara cedri]|uniref:Uncharacterized protein n=1 Tax=Cinara cedri TaxID=506608 RepID=A0A5E4MNV5_9HEMI|nr:Hypothetical protein CINCED_3A015972 [Cinara cedri]